MKELLTIALSQYGVQEIAGAAHNPVILDYFREIGHVWNKADETAWCSAFANWVALKAGYEQSGKLNARSWQDVGYEVSKPEAGDLVVLWRESPQSWKGHVGFFINYSQNGQYINCLGGNQSDKVCIRPYPVERLLSFRQLNKIT